MPRGSVAQLVERTTENREVTGSTPVGATETLVRLLLTGVSSCPFIRESAANTGRVAAHPTVDFSHAFRTAPHIQMSSFSVSSSTPVAFIDPLSVFM